MMRILHVYKDYPPVRGGIEHQVHLLATGQVARGHEVSVVVAASGCRTTSREEGGVLVLRAARLGTLRSVPLSPSLIFHAWRRPADIVHLHYPHPPGELAWWLRRFTPRAVVSYHADFVRQKILGRMLRPLTRAVLRRASCILVSSPAMASESPEVRRHADRVSVVSPGLPAPPQVPDGEIAEVERRFPGPRVLFVGRLRHYKGLDHLIEAMASVPGRLLITGDGPMRSSLQQRATASAAGDRVVFLGEVDQDALWALYAAADVFVLPSDSPAEAFGLVLAEAMAMGVPVISTELGTGTSWVNRHEETGLVVPPADPSALTRALQTLLNDPGLRRRMGDSGRQRVLSEFMADRMIDRVQEVYEDALGGNEGFRP